MKRMIIYGLVVVAVAILAHHYWKHGSLADSKNILSHEFLLSIVLGALIGGLLL